MELAYALCYPLVPVGMACLYAGGAATEATRYWTAVLLSGALSYGMLPWLPTRSPRETSGEPASMPVMRSVNLRVLRRGSVRWNTFPSGHVATSLAAALAVGVPLPWTGAALGVLALGIAVAAVVGRYHYGADVVAGVGVGLAAFAVSRFA
jgi:membrane-associated phospholipid phosphatase